MKPIGGVLDMNALKLLSGEGPNMIEHDIRALRADMAELFRELRHLKEHSPSRLFFDEQFSSLNHKVDRLMTQHDEINAALDAANTKLDTLTTDVQALIAAVQAGSQSGDFSDSLQKANDLSAKIGTADDAVKAATPPPTSTAA